MDPIAEWYCDDIFNALTKAKQGKAGSEARARTKGDLVPPFRGYFAHAIANCY